MAAKRRHWKEKNGRFWARVAVPKDVQEILGKTELIEPLGGDRRLADQLHVAAVARLQVQIANARTKSIEGNLTHSIGKTQRELLQTDIDDVVWTHYHKILEDDLQKRATMPSATEVEAELERFYERLAAGETRNNSIAALTLAGDYELKASARKFYQNHRQRRLTALKTDLASGDTKLVDGVLSQIMATRQLSAEAQSADYRRLAHNIMRSEIEALTKTLARDEGDYSSKISDPIVKEPAVREPTLPPVSLLKLFSEYISKRQAIGKHADGGANWDRPFQSLISFLGHSDARKVTKRSLQDWRDFLMNSGKSASTVSKKYLAAIRAVLSWAHVEGYLPTDESQGVVQEIPRKVTTREKGYTTNEANVILKASNNYRAVKANNPSNQESAHVTAAKNWAPLLCAHTGARITEITQLRKEDVTLIPATDEGKETRWQIRISPEAGSVKTGQYRDVPLHSQIVELGFIRFVQAASDGPLFHTAQSPDKFLQAARGTAGKVSQWLQSLEIVPNGVQPSHGWRHRFMTIGRELGVSDRVLAAIEGHAGKTASDSYGDVTIAAKLKAIDAFPKYDLPH
jgi:integrase